MFSKVTARAWATVAAKAAACAVAAIALTAEASAKGFTVSAFGGANWADVANFSSVDTNTGYVVGGALGASVGGIEGLRGELEVSFRHDPVNVGSLEIAHNTTGVLANVVFDLPIAVGPLKPYVLGGVGFAHTTASLSGVSAVEASADGIAYQVGAGINYDLGGGVGAGVGYRYLVGPELEYLGTQLSDSSNHTVEAHVSFSFE